MCNGILHYSSNTTYVSLEGVYPFILQHFVEVPGLEPGDAFRTKI